MTDQTNLQNLQFAPDPSLQKVQTTPELQELIGRLENIANDLMCVGRINDAEAITQIIRFTTTQAADSARKDALLLEIVELTVPLTSQGEDAIWRPATAIRLKARQALETKAGETK